jgi:hypothetical protein
MFHGSRGLRIINGNGALRAILIKRPWRGNTDFRKFFFFSPKALKPVRRTQIPFIIYRLSFLINNYKTTPLAAGGNYCDSEGWKAEGNWLNFFLKHLLK